MNDLMVFIIIMFVLWGFLPSILFFGWLVVGLSFFMLADSTIKRLSEKGRTVPAWVDISYDLGVVFVLVWHGAWAIGSAWVVHMIIVATAWQKVKELNDNHP